MLVMDNLFRIGIDVGSTTVKAVVLDSNDYYLKYEGITRYKTPPAYTKRHIHKHRGRQVTVSITGSAGIEVAENRSLFTRRL